VRVIVGGFNGLRFTADGLKLIAADFGNDRVSVFCAEDGSFLRHIASRVVPLDVEECAIDGDDGRAGVVVCHSGGLVAVVDAVVRRIDLDFNCHALARIPGVGLVVRHDTGVQFFATPDAVAMASMSLWKVAWMTAVCRVGFRKVIS